MPEVEFFSAFGLLAVPEFLDRQLCGEICTEMTTAAGIAATVRGADRSYVVDERNRKTNWATVSEATSTLVRERLLSLRDEVERVFGIAVTGVQEPQFLRYGEGDFFAAHQDRGSDDKGAQFARERQVSALTFLNDGDSPDPDSYEGGALTLFGLVDSGDGRDIGLPVQGRAGALIAFPSDMLHEVTPITRGRRFTVVSWFY